MAVSGTVFFHTGVPFTALERALYRQRQWNSPRRRSAICERGGRPSVRATVQGVTQPGTIQWLNPNAFVSTVDASTGACAGGDSSDTASSAIWDETVCGVRFTWSDLYREEGGG